jgi:hypothetical protein
VGDRSEREAASAAVQTARHRTGASINVILKMAELAGKPLGVGEDALRRFANYELDLRPENRQRVHSFFRETEAGRFLVGLSGPQSPYWALLQALRTAGVTLRERGVCGAYLAYHAGYVHEDEFVVRLIEIALGEDDALIYKEYLQEQHVDNTVRGHEGDGVVIGIGGSVALVPFNPCPYRPFHQILFHKVALQEGYSHQMIGMMLGAIGPEEVLPRHILLMKPNVIPDVVRLKRHVGAWRWRHLGEETQRYFGWLQDHVVDAPHDPVSRIRGVRRK